MAEKRGRKTFTTTRIFLKKVKMADLTKIKTVANVYG